MLRVTIAAVSIAFLSTAAAARDTARELAVNLKFSPQESVASNSPDLLPAVTERPIVLRVEDGRGDEPNVIGHGTNDDDVRFPIRSSVEVIPFITDAVKQVTNEWGIRQADQAEQTLTFRVTRFYVEESNKAFGSMYAAEVKFTYLVAGKNGRKLLEGASSGSARRYGRARSGDNCNEVLSDAMKEALATAFADSKLQEVLSTGKSIAAEDSAASESVEERLRKLDDLLKKKLITKEEYDRKRAEILNDL